MKRLTVSRRTGLLALCCSLLAACGGPLDADRVAESREALITAAPTPQVARSQHRLGQRGVMVVIVGGNPSLTPSVEILDPAAGTIISGPPLIANRRAHAMVTLNDGTLLVLGGLSTSGVLSSAELLSTTSSAWQAAAPMPAAVYGHSATVLNDGRVLVVGGVGYRTSAWLYDPVADAWSTTGSLATGRMSHAAVRLPDGRVLVAGGSASAGGTSTAEVYDPSTGSWSTVGSMAMVRSSPDLVRIDTGARAGAVLVAGDGTSVEQFNGTGFTSFASTNAPHASGRFLALADGSVLLYGDSYGALAIEQMGASATSWAVVDSMPATRNDAPGLQLSDGRALVVGGRAYPAGGGGEFARADAFYWSPSGGCTPRTCASAGATCGSISDNCGGTLSCGSCGAGYACNSSNTCVAACVPRTCASVGATCGNLPDNCGGTLSCGTCGAGTSCTQYTCVATCTPTSCAALGLSCGTAPDGCGGTLSCGPACGGAGTVVASYDATLRAPLCGTTAQLCSATTTGRASLGPEANAPNTLGSTCADGTSGTFHSDESVDAVRVRSATTAALAPGGAAQAEVDVWAYVGYSSDVVDLYVTATPSSPVWTLIGSRTATKAGAQTIIVPFILPSASGPRFAIRAQFRYLGSASSCTSGPYNDRDDLVFTVAGGGGSSGLINGGFESGLASWSGAGSVSADTTAGLSHSGASHAVLRAQYGAPAALTQSFTVPAGVTTLTLYARPETATTTVLDVSLRVTLAASGVAILDSAVASNLTNPGTWSPISLDVTRFAGTNATLTLRSDSNVISSSEFFRVDDVSLH